MVCAKHKDVAKTKIKKYREARKAKKLGIKPAKTAKPAKGMKRRTVASNSISTPKPPVAVAA